MLLIRSLSSIQTLYFLVLNMWKVHNKIFQDIQRKGFLTDICDLPISSITPVATATCPDCVLSTYNQEQRQGIKRFGQSKVTNTAS